MMRQSSRCEHIARSSSTSRADSVTVLGASRPTSRSVEMIGGTDEPPPAALTAGGDSAVADGGGTAGSTACARAQPMAANWMKIANAIVLLEIMSKALPREAWGNYTGSGEAAHLGMSQKGLLGSARNRGKLRYIVCRSGSLGGNSRA